MPFVLRRAKGGHLVHMVPQGQWKALCGFEPRAVRHGGRHMIYRHGWVQVTGGIRTCRRCKELEGTARHEAIDLALV